MENVSDPTRIDNFVRDVFSALPEHYSCDMNTVVRDMAVAIGFAVHVAIENARKAGVPDLTAAEVCRSITRHIR